VLGRDVFYHLLYLLSDMQSADGDADAAVEARIRIGWNKFRQLVPLLTNKDVSLITKGRVYSSCVRTSVLHGSETWPVRKENVVALQRCLGCTDARVKVHSTYISTNGSKN